MSSGFYSFRMRYMLYLRDNKAASTVLSTLRDHGLDCKESSAMESITQLSLDGIAPDAPITSNRNNPREAAAQKRYYQTEHGKAKNRNHQQAWRDRQGDEYREKM